MRVVCPPLLFRPAGSELFALDHPPQFLEAREAAHQQRLRRIAADNVSEQHW